MLAGSPELKVQADQSFDCSCLTPSGGSVSSPYPPSLASRSNTQVPPDLLSRFRAKLAIFPPLVTRFSLSFSSSLFSGICLYFPAPFFTLQSGIFPSPSHASQSGISLLHISTQPPPLTHPLSSHFLSLRFRSIFLFTISLALFIPLPVHPSLLRLYK